MKEAGTPKIKQFPEGKAAEAPELETVLSGAKFVRNLNHRLTRRGLIKQEEVAGPQYQSDGELRECIKIQAWGLHASCTNKIGVGDPLAVLGYRFRMRPTQGLRVTDVSVFPYWVISSHRHLYAPRQGRGRHYGRRPPVTIQK